MWDFGLLGRDLRREVGCTVLGVGRHQSAKPALSWPQVRDPDPISALLDPNFSVDAIGEGAHEDVRVHEDGAYVCRDEAKRAGMRASRSSQ